MSSAKSETCLSEDKYTKVYDEESHYKWRSFIGRSKKNSSSLRQLWLGKQDDKNIHFAEVFK